MRGQNIIRIIALIGLCALVYYFSFDNGRRTMQPRIKSLEQSLAAKDRVIDALALEVQRLKKELKKQEEAPAEKDFPSAEDLKSGRIKLELDSSRILLDQRLVLSCVEIDQEKKQALLQVNLLQGSRPKSEMVKLGQGLKFDSGGRAFILFLDRIHSGFVMARLILD